MPLRVSALLSVLILLVYANSFQAPWELDDYHNIVVDERISAMGSSFQQLLGSIGRIVYENPFNRPLARISFAVNWYIGQENPAGYHVFNIAIHCLTAFFLYLTCLKILQGPRLSGIRDHQRIGFVSLLSAAIWALNPIQVQAVTYIVQRMASLAAMFSVIAILLYLKGRASDDVKSRYMFFLAGLLSWIAGCLCKENAVLVPLNILLIEAIFFQDLSRPDVIKKLLAIAGLFCVAIAVVGMVLFLDGKPLGIFASENRFFSTGERLLTQARIVLRYLTLLFYPAPHRLSIVHDIAVSKSLFSPWTTLLSVMIVAALVIVAFWKLRRWPLVSFAILFFFLNHLVESTIIPLELVFEHRNYSPSLFLFLPVAAGMDSLIQIYRTRNRAVCAALWAFIPLLLIGLGTGTYARNMVWTSERSLWEDAVTKAPASSRAIHYLAWVYHERLGDDRTALLLYRKALGARMNHREQRARIYNNMAAIFYSRADYEPAAQYWAEAAKINPNTVELRYRSALALVKAGRPDSAMGELDRIIAGAPEFTVAKNLQAILLLNQGRAGDAMPLLQDCVRARPNHAPSLVNLAACFYQRGDYPKARLLLNQARKLKPDAWAILLWLSKTQLAIGRLESADSYLESWLLHAPLNEVQLRLTVCAREYFFDDAVICPPIDDDLRNRVAKIYASSLK